MIFACRRNSVALLFHPDRQGKLLRTSSIQNPGSQDVRLKDLDLLKGFRGSRGRFSIRLEPGTTSVNEQLLQNQNPALISLPVSQTLRLVPLFVVIRGIFQWCGHGWEVFFPVWNLHASLEFSSHSSKQRFPEEASIFKVFGDKIWTWLSR